MPTITATTAVADSLTLTTQDADTIGTATDTASPSANFAAAFETAANADRNYGADGAGTTGVSGYTLNVTGLGGAVTSVDSGLDSNGQNVMLSKDGNDVVGSTSAGEVFRISVSTTGTVTLTQSAELDHVGTGNGSQIALATSLVTLSATATVTDGDTDTATASYSLDLGGNIRFDDDVPTITAQSMVLANQTANVATASLNLDIGADGFGSVTISGAVNGSGYAIDSSGNVLKSGTLPLTYITVGGTLYATTNLSTNGAVFSVNPDEATGTYTITMLGTLDAQTATFNSDFNTNDAGTPDDPYTSYFTAPGSLLTQRVDIFGFGASEVNPSTDGLGIGNGNVKKDGQVGVFFGTTVDKAFVTMGNFKGDSYDWKAVNITTAATAVIAGLPDVDPAGAGWSLQEFYDSITIVGSNMFASLDGNAAVVIGDVVPGGTGTVTGPSVGGNNENQTDMLNPATPFNFLYLAGNAQTDGAGFKITQLSFDGDTTASPVKVNFTATATDGDMDTATSNLTATFAGHTNGSFTLVSTPGGEVLDGSTGSDTFVWKPSDTGSDKITDFNLAPVASGGDVLVLKDLLVDEHSNPTSLDAYLHFSAEAGTGKTVITVDANGVADGGNGQSITLQNVAFDDLQTNYGTTDVAIITKLLADGNLKTDI